MDLSSAKRSALDVLKSGASRFRAAKQNRNTRRICTERYQRVRLVALVSQHSTIKARKRYAASRSKSDHRGSDAHVQAKESFKAFLVLLILVLLKNVLSRSRLLKQTAFKLQSRFRFRPRAIGSQILILSIPPIARAGGRAHRPTQMTTIHSPSNILYHFTFSLLLAQRAAAALRAIFLREAADEWLTWRRGLNDFAPRLFR